MRKTNQIILISIIGAILLLGIGYAAIQNITLNIAGTASADPNQSNFKVMFSGTPIVSDDIYVTTAITDDTNATINVDGFTKKGDVATVIYTVQNASEDLSADLGVSTTNDNTEFFTLSSELAQTSLVAGESTTLTVTVELTKTPITDSVSTTIGVQLEAIPVQPGEEGTSAEINGSSQTPDGTNEYGFYYDKFYANQDEGLGFIAHEDGSVEEFKYIQEWENDDSAGAQWMCEDYSKPGEVNYDEMKSNGATILKNGKVININGLEYEMLDIDVHGIYYGNEYFHVDEDSREMGITVLQDGTLRLALYENGEVAEYMEEHKFFYEIANGYLMTREDTIALKTNVNGEVLFFELLNQTFTLRKKHNYVEEIIKENTCTEEGERKYTCSECNKEYTIFVPADNHSKDTNSDGICDKCNQEITYVDFELDAYNRKKIGYTDSITELVIPSIFFDGSTNTWYRIISVAYNAFNKCSNLTNVIISEGITTIDEFAFSECTNLSNILLPSSITTIGDGVFWKSSNLKSINIPSGCSFIDDSAFKECSALTEINVEPDNLNYCSIDGILCSKDGTRLIRYPGGKIPSDIIIPESVTTICEHAFNACTNLSNVVLPNGITTIQEHAFDSCDSLISIVIPEGVTTVYKGTFINCKNLTSVSFPKTLKTIEAWAFQGCNNLGNVYIPENVNYIDYVAFLGCENVFKINIDPNNSTYSSIDGIVYSKDLTKLVKYPEARKESSFIIPKEVTTIGRGALYECEYLRSIVIPKEVTTIEDLAFSYCSKLNYVNYTGTQEQWEAIEIGDNSNDYLINATINYNYVIPTE